MVLRFPNRYSRNLAFLMINSNVFFWRWRVLGDAFDVTSAFVCNCPVPRLLKEQVTSLSDTLLMALRSAKPPKCIEASPSQT